MNRQRPIKRIAVTIFSALCIFSLYAEEPPVKIATLANLARQRNPKIKAIENEVQAFSFRIAPAATLPDPMVEIGLKNMGLGNWTVGREPESGIGVSISQGFPFFGKLRLKGEIARKEFERKNAFLESTKLEVVRDVKTAFFDLFYTQKSIGILEEQRRLLTQTLKLSETQYAVGGGAQSDIFKAQIEISKMDEMIIPMREMVKTLEARINLLLDYPADRPLGMPEVSEATVPLLPLAELEKRIVSFSPMARDAALMVEESDRMVAMAKKEFYPDFQVKVGWEYKGKLSDMFELMVGLEIPLFQKRKQAGWLKDARAQEAGSRENSLAVRNDLLAMVSENYVKAKISEKLLNLYKNQLRIQSRLAVESSLANYQVGKVDLMSVLDDINNQFSFEQAYFRELSHFWTAVAVLESLGTDPLADQ